MKSTMSPTNILESIESRIEQVMNKPIPPTTNLAQFTAYGMATFVGEVLQRTRFANTFISDHLSDFALSGAFTALGLLASGENRVIERCHQFLSQ